MSSIVGFIRNVRKSPEEKFLDAIHDGKLELAQKISKKWNDAKFKDIFVEKTDATPMHFAAQNGSVKLLTWLIEKGALIDHPMNQPKGWTPLKTVVQRNHILATRYLLDAGIDINDPKECPLKIACDQDHHKLALHLLAWGADPAQKNKEGRKPLESIHYREIDKELESKFIKEAIKLAKKHKAPNLRDYVQTQYDLAYKDFTQLDTELTRLIYAKIEQKLIHAFEQFNNPINKALGKIPRDVRLMIWSYIPGHELMGTLRLVSKEWNKLIISDLAHISVVKSKFSTK